MKNTWNKCELKHSTDCDVRIDALCEKQEVSLALLSRILTRSCVTPPYIFRQRVTHDCADNNAKGTSCVHDFSHSPFLTSPFIDFCTCMYIHVHVLESQ